MEDDEVVKISKKQLERLVMRSLKLDALEGNGVDNWISYSDALCDPESSYQDARNCDNFFDEYCKFYVID